VGAHTHSFTSRTQFDSLRRDNLTNLLEAHPAAGAINLESHIMELNAHGLNPCGSINTCTDKQTKKTAKETMKKRKAPALKLGRGRRDEMKKAVAGLPVSVVSGTGAESAGVGGTKVFAYNRGGSKGKANKKPSQKNGKRKAKTAMNGKGKVKKVSKGKGKKAVTDAGGAKNEVKEKTSGTRSRRAGSDSDRSDWSAVDVSPQPNYDDDEVLRHHCMYSTHKRNTIIAHTHTG
jgi:hypothetical protein